MANNTEISNRIDGLGESLGLCFSYIKSQNRVNIDQAIEIRNSYAQSNEALDELKVCYELSNKTANAYQELQLVKANAPHVCKGWGWASDNVFCPMENAWQDSSTEIKYAVIAGVSVVGVAIIGVAVYGAYAYFHPNVIVAAAVGGITEQTKTLFNQASDELLDQIARGYKAHNGHIKITDLTDICKHLGRPTVALEFFENLTDTQQEYLGEIAPHVIDFLNNPGGFA